MPITDKGKQMVDTLKIYPERFELVDRVLERWSREDIPTINALVLKDGVTVYTATYGISGPSQDAHELKLDSIYQIASITKTITATCIVMLAEDGEIELNDPVGKYIPEFKAEDKRDIVIWHLLTHTSGLDDEVMYQRAEKYVTEELNIEFDRDNWENTMLQAARILNINETSPDKIWKSIKYKMEPKHRPREAMSYCSTGFDIAKEIVEIVTNESIETFAYHRLFEPLGMVDTHWALPEEKWSRVIKRGEGVEGYPWYNNVESYTNMSGGGGLKSTAPDIIKFAEMIRLGGSYNGKRILSPITVNGMLKNHNKDVFGAWEAWTLGFNYHDIKCDDMGILRPETAVDHGGYGGTRVYIDRENGISWVLFTVKPAEANIFSKFTNMINSCFG